MKNLKQAIFFYLTSIATIAFIISCNSSTNDTVNSSNGYPGGTREDSTMNDLRFGDKANAPDQEIPAMVRKAAREAMNDRRFGDKANAPDMKEKGIYRTADQPIHFYEIGNVLAEKGKYTQAINYYTKALGFNPKLEEVYINRGNCYSALKDYKMAIKDYTEAIKINPKSGMSYYNLGWAYHSIGDKVNSCKNWKKAIEFDYKIAIDALNLYCD